MIGQQQVKVLVPRDTAEAFRAACVETGISMASVLTRYMAEYADRPLEKKKEATTDYSTRRRRRSALRIIVKELVSIRASEERSRDNTPVNLRGAEQCEKADEIISLIEEAIEALESVMVP